MALSLSLLGHQKTSLWQKPFWNISEKPQECWHMSKNLCWCWFLAKHCSCCPEAGCCHQPHEERKRKLLICHPLPGLHSFSHVEFVCLIKDLFKCIHTFPFQLCFVGKVSQGLVTAHRVDLETWLPAGPGCAGPGCLQNPSFSHGWFSSGEP